jgi:uncharacterized protein (UPF0297 family)
MPETKKFDFGNGERAKLKKDLAEIYNALEEKGYDPVNQIAGYIITEDPAYITSYKDARSKMARMDRYDILKELIKSYLEVG